MRTIWRLVSGLLTSCYPVCMFRRAKGCERGEPGIGLGVSAAWVGVVVVVGDDMEHG